jgi:hypothetical protein
MEMLKFACRPFRQSIAGLFKLLQQQCPANKPANKESLMIAITTTFHKK